MRLIERFINPKLLILSIGAIFIIPVSLVSAHYMNGPSGSNPPIPFWMALTFAIISFVIGVIFVFLTIKTKKNKAAIFFCVTCVTIVVINLVMIFLQPSTINSHVMIKSYLYPNVGEYIDVTTHISNEKKIIYFFEFTILVMYLYSGFFLLPVYIKSVKLIQYLIYAFLTFFVVSFTYSLIVEFDKYGLFLKSLFSPNIDSYTLSQYAVFSFFGHRNIYAMFITTVIIHVLVNYVVSKKKYNIVIIVSLLAYLLFTYSRSSILLTYVLVMVFFYAYSFSTLRENRKKKIYLLLLVTTILLASLISFIVTYSVNPSFKSNIDSLIKGVGTIGSRKNIWDTVIEVIYPKWILFGRGYGIVVTMLNDIGPVALGEVVAHEHSVVFSLLAKGGIVLLLSFVIVIAYSSYLFYKSFRVNKEINIPLLLGFMLFFIHSFIENNYLMILLFITEMQVFANLNSNNDRGIFNENCN